MPGNHVPPWCFPLTSNSGFGKLNSEVVEGAAHSSYAIRRMALKSVGVAQRLGTGTVLLSIQTLILVRTRMKTTANTTNIDIDIDSNIDLSTNTNISTTGVVLLVPEYPWRPHALK